jgi:predicted type IV restriction endonuclease
MPIPTTVIELVERFERNREAYRSGQYNETQVRHEFIDPFFEALGWDVNNRQGYAEAYKDVIHEDAIKVGGATKAPDYCFRIGGTRKFFLEAKKPSVNIKEDIHPAYQLRRYAWSAKLPLSILTDFEEFAVYDCRPKPDKADKATAARTLYLTYRDYPQRWDELAGVFSREAVLKGSFDHYAESNKAKKGTAEVDTAFLQEIERWRDLLARNIALRNPGLSQRQLNSAIQTTIDRLIFLRIAEDRGLEPYGRLQALQNGGQVYNRLTQLFRLADDRYNSGLFHFKPEKGRESPDEWSLQLQLDDKALKDILKNLYYPDSPYEFSVLPADILGQVYEQFLGKVIRLSSGHRAVVEDKPEVKKAGGVYYTPTYIVDYIVSQTVGKRLEDWRIGGMEQGKQPPSNLPALRILDPACGSGSFLIGAYQYLLDWYLQFYTSHQPEKWTKRKNPPIIQTSHSAASTLQPANLPNFRLTTAERKRILLEHIFGVDIDPQAVEVTKLSLLLKVLEGESEHSLATQLTFFQERALPDLAANIKCGNSLIGPDFYDHQPAQMSFLLAEEERYRINVFDWQGEFPHIMRDGGFDVVIGNPPYIQSRAGLVEEVDKLYYNDNFETAEYQINTYGLFVEKSIKLLRSNGFLGMIIPNYWLSTGADSLLRKFLFFENEVLELTNVYRVFTNATVDTLLLFVRCQKNTAFPKKYMVRSIDRSLKTITERLSAIRDQNWNFVQTHTLEAGQRDVNISFSKTFQLNGKNTLADYFSFRFGMKPYQVGKGKPPQTNEILKNKGFNSKTRISEDYKPLLYAGDIKRYALVWQGEWIKYGQHLAEPRTPDLFEGPRILVRRIVSGKYLDGIYTDQAYICNTDVITLQPIEVEKPNTFNILFFLGILLSLPCAVFLKSQNVNLDRETFPKINTKTLSVFPVPKIDFTNPAEKAQHDHIVTLVEQMLALHQQLAAAKTGHEQTSLQRHIAALDRQIDRLVYGLYHLSEEEIKIVEGN